jgi:PAS domain S-box-containing protein
MTEQQYWSNRDFMVDLLRQLPLHVFWKNKEGVYLGCNEAFADTLGLASPDEIIGKTDYDLPTTREESNFYRVTDKQVMKSRQPRINIEESQTLPDGKKLVLLTSKVPLVNKEDKIVGILGIYTDITERKQMEEQLRQAKEAAEAANQAKTNFIANMSHDIRTPLNGVIGTADMLNKEGTSEKDKYYGQIIRSSGQILLSLIDDILDLMRLGNMDEKKVKQDTIHLTQQLQKIADLIAPSIHNKNLQFELNIDPELDTEIIIDRIKLERILINILSNSIKFTAKGEIKLEATLLKNVGGEGKICFQISDTGIGIPKEAQNKVFDLFYRVTASSKGAYSGHGIGLYNTKAYVEMLGGNIEFESVEGEGTTFYIELPCLFANKEIADKDLKVSVKKISVGTITKTTQEVKKSKPLYKALLIEDDPVAQQIEKYYLQNGGFEVQVVPDAEAAIKIVKSSEFDLIVSDIGLPGLNGNEFTLLMRYWEKISKKPRTPIIGLSANASDEVKEESLLTGMDLMLIKPFNDTSLQEIVDLAHAKNSKPQIKTRSEKEFENDLPEDEQELFNLDAYPLIDEEDACNTVGDKAILVELLDIFVDETIPQEFSQLVKAYEQQDWKHIQTLAHKLKGGAMYCGAIRMRYACHYLEKYLLAGHSELAEKLFQQLSEVLEDTKAQAMKWLGNNQSCDHVSE